MKILTVENKKEEKLLRQKTKEIEIPLDLKIKKIIPEMKEIMKKNDGVGLSANQIGLPWRFFVAEYQNKSYVLINPKILKHSKKIILAEEGCLSVPNLVGLVPRYESIIIEAFNSNNKKIKIKAKNMLARIFQHEIDHLDGIIFTDKAKKIYQINNKNEK
jgi:peptide deformylase